MIYVNIDFKSAIKLKLYIVNVNIDFKFHIFLHNIFVKPISKVCSHTHKIQNKCKNKFYFKGLWSFLN